MSKHQKLRVYDLVRDGKEELIFGFACHDGTDWVEADMQGARLLMYGFD